MDSDGGLNEVTRQQLQRGGEAEVGFLKLMLDTRQVQAGQAAFRVALSLPEPHRFALLAHAVHSPNPLVGGMAAEALRDYGEQAVKPLLEALSSTSALVRLKVIFTLGEIGSRAAVGPLLETLRMDTAPSIRYTTIQALGAIGDPSVVEALRPYLNDADHHVREHTQVALQQLGALPDNE